MDITDCKIGMRVKDNIKSPWLSNGTGTITGFCKNLFGQPNIIIKWDSPESDRKLIMGVAPQNVDAIKEMED